MITQQRLKELLHYNPETGVFTWINPPETRVCAGDVAGAASTNGGVRIKLDVKMYSASQLAWLYVYGEWPEEMLSFINHDATDNRISNLRLATRSDRGGTRKLNKNSSSGYKGVSWNQAAGMWWARIQRNKVKYDLGLHTTPKAAHEAYVEAAKTLFGEFARVA
ncbi:MAG: HNH endonuclease [Gammaproteobacteria bacterium]|jgi:hypothetical protein|nr:HNH endonuclease [Gammaproteobacteria bacterium]MBT4605756.1 HNH endonuclease [Thiotrichales bacterium]MBT7830119.1 HNH endonuclease [Candidatus Neomarinimicrobiota bacterium]MBT3844143.1 HNH endonuclease [Gammaproteobacteria bacterium]MBT4080944.1 HNH endonuclease [Gammaproteobacteria bacterium]